MIAHIKDPKKTLPNNLDNTNAFSKVQR
jgi:hypothetical protein